MQNKKAIDVVLLPSAEMMEKAIVINRYLLQRGDANMALNTTDCLPHISILMGCMADEDLPRLSSLLNDIASQYTLLHLQITEFGLELGSAVLNVEKDARLQNLHLEIAGKLSPLLTYDAVAEMLYNPAEVGANALKYINNFLQNASYEKYSPHITVGNGVYTQGNFPMSFTAPTLAICHLGSYCTCRKILYQVQLPEKEK